jgi:hypothetical protein
MFLHLSSFFRITFFSSLANAKGTFLAGILTGFASPVAIECSAKCVKPRSYSFVEKALQYLHNNFAMASFS